MNESTPIIDVLRLVSAGIVGGLIGALSQHYFAKSREKHSGEKARRREFIAFVSSWRVEVARTYWEIGGFTRKYESFSDVVSGFVAQCKLIREDFPDQRRVEFDRLAKVISSIDGRTINNQGGHAKIDKALEDMLAFMENRPPVVTP